MSKGRRLKAIRSAGPHPSPSPNSVRISDARTPSDRRAIGDLFRSRIRGVTQQVDVVWPKENLEALLAPHGISVTELDLIQLIARDRNGVVVGGLQSQAPLGYMRSAREPADALRIKQNVRLLEHLAVSSTIERQGVGRRMLEEAARRHANAGAKQWVGGVDRSQPDTLIFYQHVGFGLFDRFSELPPPTGRIRVRRQEQRAMFWIHRWLDQDGELRAGRPQDGPSG